MEVELVAYTRGVRGAKPLSLEPVEVCGHAGGICWDKEEKEDYGGFIKRIIKIGHESVIEHASFTFRVEGVSRALTHQLVRHRIASYSQRSQRYVDEGEFEYVLPPLDYIEDVHDRIPVKKAIEDSIQRARGTYQYLRDRGVKSEDARFVLPNAVCSKIYITMNARSLRNFFNLRLSKHAQWEIREMAKRMLLECMKVAPAFFEDICEKYLKERYGGD